MMHKGSGGYWLDRSALDEIEQEANVRPQLIRGILFLVSRETGVHARIFLACPCGGHACPAIELPALLLGFARASQGDFILYDVRAVMAQRETWPRGACQRCASFVALPDKIGNNLADCFYLRKAVKDYLAEQESVAAL